MTDTIRMVFTYTIAFVIVVGGGAIVYLSPEGKPIDATISLAIGAAIAFVFGQETSTRSARQSTAASESGAVLHANGLVAAAPAQRAPETRT